VSAKYLLPCECGEHQPVTTAQAGETITCPRCGTQVDVPALGLMKHLEPADAATHHRRIRRWTARKAWMMAGCLLVVGALLVLAVLWAVRPRPPDPAQLTLSDSWAVWMGLRQGLDRRVSWYTYQLIESRKILRAQTYICLAVAAIGLVITLVAFAVRDKRIVRQVSRPHAVRGRVADSRNQV
jgi:hypothetical protein